MPKALDSGDEDARFESRYDLVKDHGSLLSLLPYRSSHNVCNCNASGALLTNTFNLNLKNKSLSLCLLSASLKISLILLNTVFGCCEASTLAWSFLYM